MLAKLLRRTPPQQLMGKKLWRHCEGMVMWGKCECLRRSCKLERKRELEKDIIKRERARERERERVSE